MNRRRFLTLTFKVSVVGGLALGGATTLHRLLWDYEPSPAAQFPASSATPQSIAATSLGAPSGEAAEPSPKTATGEEAKLRCLSRREYVILRAAALRILDGATPEPHLDGAARQCAFIDRYLAELDGGLRSDVKAVFSLLELYPTVTGHFTRFSRLSAAAQDQVLASWQASRTALLRQALQALKALCFLAHYQDERSFAGIGYSGPIVPKAGLGRLLSAP